MARTVKTRLVGPAREPLVRALDEVRAKNLSTFASAESVYLAAMQEFDRLVADGTATQGDIQNGKGDFLNDLLVVLLENCSGKALHARPAVPGLSFPRHKLDIAYPETGLVEFTIETKATGVPLHPRNPRQKNPEGRAGSADLEKRVKEGSLKVIDIKAEQARVAGVGGGPTSDLRTFLRRSPPLCYLLLSARVRDAGDLAHCIRFAGIANAWFDDVGLYCYFWNDARTTYERKLVPATFELDRVLAGVCTALRNLP